MIGAAFGYVLWFGIAARLPTATAAIGTLLVPMIGVIGAMAIIGDRPTLCDAFGFVLILAAVMLTRRRTA